MTIALSMLFSQTTFAGRDVNSRLNGGNAAIYCAGGISKGMVWLSNDGSDYYSERVIVGETATWVGVQIRGALNSCSTPPNDPADTQVWAVNVAPSAASSGRLSISGTEFYRGNIDRGVANQWSYGHEANPFGFLNASLNVAGIAPCSAAVGNVSTGSITVGVFRGLQYRQFRWSDGGQYNTNGVPDTENVSVPVTRNCPLDFALTPTITVDPTIIEESTDVTVAPFVNNSGSTASSSAQWQVTRFTVGPGLPVPTGADNATTPVNHYLNGAIPVASGSQAFAANDTTDLTELTQNIPDLAVGTRVCFALSVSPVTQSDPNWRHGEPACVTVGKRPKVQVLGGDLNVGRESSYNSAPVGGSRVSTSTTRSSSTGLSYGSWSEYAIIASGNVRGMASGALYVDGTTETDLCRLSLLTISNTTTSGCQAAQVGNFAFNSTAPAVATRFPVTATIAGNSVDLYTLAHSQVYSVSSPNLSVSSSQPFADNGAGKGRWVVINDPDSTITIADNLVNSNAPLSEIDDIPQIVIIAQNIIIAPNVTNVDAWLIAVGTGSDGYINTCGSVTPGAPTSASLNSDTCNTRLTVNGPIMANKLYMYRTAGSGVGAAAGDPAEVFNLRADAYIWASAYSPGNGRVPTVSTKELPPRF